MLDDDADFFGKIPDAEIPASEGIEIRFENAPAGPGKSVKNELRAHREAQGRDDATRRSSA